MDGLKKNKNDDPSNDKPTNNPSKNPLAYQLEEVDNDKMILCPTPKKASRNDSSADVQHMAANFAYLSQQMVNKKKSSGSKHLELQRALKAQADKKAQEKRKSLMASAKDFSERQEVSIKIKKDNLDRAKN